MSLPPDPHDDDLTGPYPDVGGRSASGPPPPPPPPPASPGAPPTEDVASLANAAAALGRDLGRPGPTGGPVVPPDGPEATPDAGGAGTRPGGAPSPRRRGRLLAAAGVAVAAVVAVVAFVAAGGDDEPAASGGDDPAAAEPGTGDDRDEGAESGPDGITDNRAESPVEAAGAMFTAAIAGDCEGVVARMTPEAYAPDGETPEEAVAECEADLARNELLGAELRDVAPVSEEGDAAVVSVTLVIGDESATQEVPMVHLADGWKVDVDR